VRAKSSYFVGGHWTALAEALLTTARSTVHWSWLSINLVVFGWRRRHHLVESLGHSDL
jgi:hypothetical protein